MKDLAYYNGKISSIDEMTVPALDRGVYFGDGVYEVTYIKNHKLFAMEDHLARFYRSLGKMKINFEKTPEELEALLQELVDKMDGDDIYTIYWQATRGTAMRSHDYPDDIKANLLVFIKPSELRDPTEPMKVITREDTRFLHCDVKTLNLIPSIMACHAAREAGCEEAIFHRGDIVTECSYSNVHIIKDGVFRTHQADNLILPGIARKHLIELCGELGIPVEEKEFKLEDLFTADEVVCSSSGNHGCPITEIDGKPVGGKAPEILKKLQDAYNEKFTRETSK